MDEESYLLRVEHCHDEQEEFKSERKNEVNFQQTFFKLVGAVVTVVVLGSVAAHVSSVANGHSSVEPTSLWSLSNVPYTNVFESAETSFGTAVSAVLEQVGFKVTRNLKLPKPFNATTAKQIKKVSNAKAKMNAAKFTKKNSKMKVIKDTKTNLQWEDWNDDDHSTDDEGGQMCESSADCIEGFCNMDEVSWGWCEPCSYFESRDQCYTDGLPQDGADECSNACYGETEETVSTTYSGDVVYSFPLSEDTGTLTDTESATQNVKSYVLNLCPGDIMHLSTCDSPTGDGYARLFDLHNDVLVAIVDDSCGLFPAIDFTNPNPHCGQFRLDLGCYSYTECDLHVDGTLEPAFPDPTLEPTMEPTVSLVTPATPSNVTFPFSVETGLMANTMGAYENTKDILFQACPGDTITLSTCDTELSNTGDSLIRLFDMVHGDELDANDDSCNLFSSIHRTLDGISGCRQFRLSAGCYSYTECSYTVTGSIVRAVVPPTMEPTALVTEHADVETEIGQAVIPAPKRELPFTAWTGDLMDTMSATQNSYVMAFDVCHGDTLTVTTCGDFGGNNTNYGDSYLRLMDYGRIPHTYGVMPYAVNDDECGLFSAITSVIHIAHDDPDLVNGTLGDRCKEFRIEAGCYTLGECGYTLQASRQAAVETESPTESPTEAPSVNSHHIVGLVSFPFHVETGTMRDTDTATNQDTSTVIEVHVCPGDYVTVSSCGSYDETDTTANDSYLNIYDDNGELVFWNDDSNGCGLMSNIEAHMPLELSGCKFFTIVAGCYAYSECSYTLDGALVNSTDYDADVDHNGGADDDHDDFYDTLSAVTPSPSMEPTQEPTASAGSPRTSYVSIPFSVDTGLLGITNSATENTKEIVFEACHGDEFFISSCGETDKDTMFVLHDEDTSDVLMEADDNCDDGSLQTKLEYTVHFSGCRRFRLSAGYYGTLNYEDNGYTVTGTIDRAANPTMNPTDMPVARETASPTHEPTHTPLSDPTESPTLSPTALPVSNPTMEPTVQPTYIITTEPSFAATDAPSMEPSFIPTYEPSHAPIADETAAPTVAPVADVTHVPTLSPTPFPTYSTTETANEEPKSEEELSSVETEHVVTAVPTLAPTALPVSSPTLEPSAKPSMEPTEEPVAHPTLEPRADPTHSPTLEPTEKEPVSDPTEFPTLEPFEQATAVPTLEPTAKPSMEPTNEPVAHPTNHPIPLPTTAPISDPTEEPTMAPNNSLEEFEQREKDKADGDIEPEPIWVQGDGSNVTEPVSAPAPEQEESPSGEEESPSTTTTNSTSTGESPSEESPSTTTTGSTNSTSTGESPSEESPSEESPPRLDQDDNEQTEVETDTPSQTSGTNDQVYKENIGDYANICMINNVPVSYIADGITINPGCVLFSSKDLATANANPQYDYASIVTICSTREAGDVIIDSTALSEFDLVFEGESLVMSVGLGDDSQATVFKEDHATGDVFKRFLGSPANSGKYDLLYSLAGNKYMGDGSTIGGNVKSVELKTSVETLSDCAATVHQQNKKVTAMKATMKQMILFKKNENHK